MNKNEENIHFNDLSRHSTLKIIWLIIAAVCLISGHLILDDTGYKFISIFGYAIPAFFLSKRFFYKHYAEWNKKGISYKFNHFYGSSFRFENISNVQRKNKELIIKNNSGKYYKYDINSIKSDDLSKFCAIIVENSNASYIDNYKDNYYTGECCSTK